MNQMSYVKRSILTAVCIAAVRRAAHGIPCDSQCGQHLLPYAHPGSALRADRRLAIRTLCGLAGPLLSSLLTGMPATAYLPIMMMELALYGLLTGLFMQLIHTRKIYVDLYISLVISLLAGRVLAGIAEP